MKSRILIVKIFIFIALQLNGQIEICGDNKSHHPVDRQILAFKDSLKEKGIDTILVYRHWKSTYGFNGYGKVIWQKNGKQFQFLSITENEGNLYNAKSMGVQNFTNYDLINFYFDNKLDTIIENPKSEIKMSHDASHFVEISYKENTYCYVIDGLAVSFNPENFRAKWIMLLSDEKK